MTAAVSVERDGADAAREALERCIGSGGVAVFPADGLYGLACDPLGAAAVERIHELKGRDEGKSAAVMYFSPLAMREVLSMAGPRTLDAIGALLPGPVTAVIANPERRYPLACREDPQKLGLRLIEGPLSGARCPILQTSANRSGEAPPASLEAVDPEILATADLVIDAGKLTGAPSTVIDLSRLDGDGTWRVLREGAMSIQDVTTAIGTVGP